MALAGAAGLVLTRETPEKHYKKLLSGLLSLYDITGYFSDMLSYSRLVCFGIIR